MVIRGNIKTPPLIIELQSDIVTGNKYLNWHWTTRSIYARKWLWLLRAARQAPEKPPDFRMKVEFICFRKRTMDRDNFCLALKPIRDCLTRLNYIRDDSEKWCIATYHPIQTDTKNPPKLRIVLEPYEYTPLEAEQHTQPKREGRSLPSRRRREGGANSRKRAVPKRPDSGEVPQEPGVG